MGTLIAILAIAALILGAAVVGMLTLILVSIRTEERRMSLTGPPPNRAGAMSRRLLGVYVRQPRAASRCRYQGARR